MMVLLPSLNLQFKFLDEKMFTLQTATSLVEDDSAEQLSQYLTEVQAASSCTSMNSLSFRKSKLAFYLKLASVSLDIMATLASQLPLKEFALFMAC